MLYLTKNLESSLLPRPMPTTGQALLTFSYMSFFYSQRSCWNLHLNFSSIKSKVFYVKNKIPAWLAVFQRQTSHICLWLFCGLVYLSVALSFNKCENEFLRAGSSHEQRCYGVMHVCLGLSQTPIYPYRLCDLFNVLQLTFWAKPIFLLQTEYKISNHSSLLHFFLWQNNGQSHGMPHFGFSFIIVMGL